MLEGCIGLDTFCRALQHKVGAEISHRVIVIALSYLLSAANFTTDMPVVPGYH